MKALKDMKFFIIIGLICASTAMGGVTIGKWIFGTNTASLPAGFTMKSDFISTTSGGTPPGMVPLGGMVAVMPQTHSNAWQAPATGVIKDGFMLANGHTITAQNVTDGSVFSAGTVLPNMVQKYPRGNTTSGAAGGANTRNIAANQLPTFTTDAHAHNWGGWWSNNDATSVTEGNGDGVQNTYSDGIYGINGWGTGGGLSMWASRLTAGHSHILTASQVGVQYMSSNSGNLWIGNASITSSTNSDTYYLPSHRHFITQRATSNDGVTRTNASQVALATEPAYTEVVWVIRVK